MDETDEPENEAIFNQINEDALEMLVYLDRIESYLHTEGVKVDPELRKKFKGLFDIINNRINNISMLSRWNEFKGENRLTFRDNSNSATRQKPYIGNDKSLKRGEFEETF